MNRKDKKKLQNENSIFKNIIISKYGMDNLEKKNKKRKEKLQK